MHTFPMERIPPTITSPAKMAAANPAMCGLRPKLKEVVWVIELAWVVQPTPKAAISVR